MSEKPSWPPRTEGAPETVLAGSGNNSGNVEGSGYRTLVDLPPNPHDQLRIESGTPPPSEWRIPPSPTESPHARILREWDEAREELQSLCGKALESVARRGLDVDAFASANMLIKNLTNEGSPAFLRADFIEGIPLEDALRRSIIEGIDVAIRAHRRFGELRADERRKNADYERDLLEAEARRADAQAQHRRFLQSQASSKVKPALPTPKPKSSGLIARFFSRFFPKK